MTETELQIATAKILGYKVRKWDDVPSIKLHGTYAVLTPDGKVLPNTISRLEISLSHSSVCQHMKEYYGVKFTQK